jgi:hypothetical protein
VEYSGGKFAASDIEPLLENLEIDYIQGETEQFRLTQAENASCVGILLPPVSREGLFETVVKNGALPRKSFSIGDSSEKRFYMEARGLFRKCKSS